MVKPRGVRLAITSGLIALIAPTALIAAAQSYTPPPPPLTTLPPCPVGKDGKPLKKQKNCDPTIYPSEKVETKKKPSDVSAAPATSAVEAPAAQQFPFPGEQTKPADKPAAQAFPFPGSEGAAQPSSGSGDSHDADVQHDPEAEKKAANTSAGKAYPFPGGATPDMPSDPDLPAPKKQPEDPASSSSSSSSSSDVPSESGSDSSSAADAPGPKGEYDDDDTAAPKLKEKGHKKIAAPQTDTERVDEDLSVAKYYGQSGNKMGAYLRAKDAVKIQPDYPEGHFVLGEAALKLGKNEEAAAELKEYLKLAPDGQRAKSAEKALEQIR